MVTPTIPKKSRYICWIFLLLCFCISNSVSPRTDDYEDNYVSVYDYLNEYNRRTTRVDDGMSDADRIHMRRREEPRRVMSRRSNRSRPERAYVGNGFMERRRGLTRDPSISDPDTRAGIWGS